MKGLVVTTMTEPDAGVIVGVDTHADFHVAAVLDADGRELATRRFVADHHGYVALITWASSFGPIAAAGIEGCGSWGTGLARYSASAGIDVIEVNRPNRQHRRRYGKSDTADAFAAARAVRSGEAISRPRGNHGPIEGLRALRIAIRSAHKARTQAINQLHSVLSTAPDELRSHLHGLKRRQLLQTAARLRPGPHHDPTSVTKATLRSLARRVAHLNTELAELTARRRDLITACAPPQLLAETGIGPAVASDLLIAIGDNPHRINTEAAFAALCGVSPIDASSGRNQRHRLNRGGDRHANNALWRIVMVRLATHQPTRDYLQRATTNGKTKREAIRNLKRYTARHTWRLLQQHPPRLDP